KTKYEPHQKVWIMKDEKPTEIEICGVNINCGRIGNISGAIRIRYHFKKGFINGGTFEKLETEVFLNKTELIDSL
ncbi:hypothetical protein, partial [Flavobacterium sp.]|uniref:hypothetical protein n=1 Tax=Flavobacterium sp. TaxID=239 RepID=UPI00262264FC